MTTVSSHGKLETRRLRVDDEITAGRYGTEIMDRDLVFRVGDISNPHQAIRFSVHDGLVYKESFSVDSNGFAVSNIFLNGPTSGVIAIDELVRLGEMRLQHFDDHLNRRTGEIIFSLNIGMTNTKMVDVLSLTPETVDIHTDTVVHGAITSSVVEANTLHAKGNEFNNVVASFRHPLATEPVNVVQKNGKVHLEGDVDSKNSRVARLSVGTLVGQRADLVELSTARLRLGSWQLSADSAGLVTTAALRTSSTLDATEVTTDVLSASGVHTTSLSTSALTARHAISETAVTGNLRTSRISPDEGGLVIDTRRVSFADDSGLRVEDGSLTAIGPCGRDVATVSEHALVAGGLEARGGELTCRDIASASASTEQFACERAVIASAAFDDIDVARLSTGRLACGATACGALSVANVVAEAVACENVRVAQLLATAAAVDDLTAVRANVVHLSAGRTSAAECDASSVRCASLVATEATVDALSTGRTLVVGTSGLTSLPDGALGVSALSTQRLHTLRADVATLTSELVRTEQVDAGRVVCATLALEHAALSSRAGGATLDVPLSVGGDVVCDRALATELLADRVDVPGGSLLVHEGGVLLEDNRSVALVHAHAAAADERDLLRLVQGNASLRVRGVEDAVEIVAPKLSFESAAVHIPALSCNGVFASELVCKELRSPDGVLDARTQVVRAHTIDAATVVTPSAAIARCDMGEASAECITVAKVLAPEGVRVHAPSLALAPNGGSPLVEFRRAREGHVAVRVPEAGFHVLGDIRGETLSVQALVARTIGTEAEETSVEGALRAGDVSILSLVCKAAAATELSVASLLAGTLDCQSVATREQRVHGHVVIGAAATDAPLALLHVEVQPLHRAFHAHAESAQVVVELETEGGQRQGLQLHDRLRGSDWFWGVANGAEDVDARVALLLNDAPLVTFDASTVALRRETVAPAVRTPLLTMEQCALSADADALSLSCGSVHLPGASLLAATGSSDGRLSLSVPLLMGGKTIGQLGEPVEEEDAVNKLFLDAQLDALFKNEVVFFAPVYFAPLSQPSMRAFGAGLSTFLPRASDADPYALQVLVGREAGQKLQFVCHPAGSDASVVLELLATSGVVAHAPVDVLSTLTFGNRHTITPGEELAIGGGGVHVHASVEQGPALRVTGTDGDATGNLVELESDSAYARVAVRGHVQAMSTYEAGGGLFAAGYDASTDSFVVASSSDLAQNTHLVIDRGTRATTLAGSLSLRTAEASERPAVSIMEVDDVVFRADRDAIQCRDFGISFVDSAVEHHVGGATRMRLDDGGLTVSGRAAADSASVGDTLIEETVLGDLHVSSPLVAPRFFSEQASLNRESLGFNAYERDDVLLHRQGGHAFAMQADMASEEPTVLLSFSTAAGATDSTFIADTAALQLRKESVGVHASATRGRLNIGSSFDRPHIVLEDEYSASASIALEEDGVKIACSQRRTHVDGVMRAEEVETDGVVFGGGLCRLRVLEGALVVEARTDDDEWVVKHELGL